MRVSLFVILVFLFTQVSFTKATPSISINFDAVSSDDKEAKNQTQFEGSAPIEVTFNMEIYDADEWTYDFEWRFCHEGGSLEEPYMIRYEENPVVTFSQAETDSIALYIRFVKGEEEVLFKRNYWTPGKPLTIKASESSLTFPNAFSPNNDGRNDTYKPKAFKSIVEFNAKIYNRWGQKLYEWDDVSSNGWDGTFHGADVKQGTYFVYVRARGADGREFIIKKDVNLLRNYNEYETGASK